MADIKKLNVTHAIVRVLASESIAELDKINDAIGEEIGEHACEPDCDDNHFEGKR